MGGGAALTGSGCCAGGNTVSASGGIARLLSVMWECHEQALEIMEAQIVPGSDQLDVRDRAAVARRIKGSVCSKMYGFEDLLSPLIAQASTPDRLN